MFFDTSIGLLRVLIVGSVAYIFLIILLRLTGKRTLSKMNAFDLVITVALGSTLATILLSKDVMLFEGLLAFALLIFLQWIVASLSVAIPRFRYLIKAQPRLLLLRGTIIDQALRDERITPEEVMAAARSNGYMSLSEIEAIILETDGNISVIATSRRDGSAMSNVRGFKESSN